MPKSKGAFPVEKVQYRNSRCSSDRHKDIHLTKGDLQMSGNIREKSGAYAKASATACRDHSSWRNEQGLLTHTPEVSRNSEGSNIELVPIR